MYSSSVTPRQATEAFHLVFLRALAAKGETKGLVALKGGCNLRFYFGSVRYSEDVDLDVVTIGKETLRKNVDRLLASPLVVSPLGSLGIVIRDSSAPKQTDTTQRWKVGLEVRGVSLPVRTKIEFSRRDSIEGAAFEATPADVTRPYGLGPVLATHYGLDAAIIQKIHALAARTEPQARDVFDLAHLFARPAVGGLALSPAQKRWLPEAIDHAMEISFDEYVAKVVAYLDPAHAVPFEDALAWTTMQERVIDALEALR